MHTDARTLENGALITGDLCIVGAGAAGISIALEWIGTGRRVILLEGGGFDYDPRMQDLYRGESVGLPYYPLQAARLHYFGGTTGHWAGFCSLLDPLDFEVRDWVPYSGWPITRTELEPFYRRAQTVVQLGPNEWSAWEWQRRDPTLVPFPLDPGVAWTKMWQFSPPTRFGTVYRNPIVRASEVHLYTHATVVEIETNESGTAVSGLRVRSLGADGKEYRARATHYVLACSTIQNARLLLASNRTVRAGVGNATDRVGRFFMEHLEMPSGVLVTLGRTPTRTRMYDWKVGTQARGELAISPDLQRRHRMLNATVSLTPAPLTEEGKSTFQWMTPDVLDAMRTGRTVTEDTVARAGEEMPRTFQLLTRQEQQPNPDSRVTLSDERDALGVPRVRLDWRLTELDRGSFRAFYQVLGRELGRAGVGRLRMREWVLDAPTAPWPSSLGGGWHHMGTTRMSHDPKQGVVNVDCRVHDVANLYVAGAAVYPTAGCVNPTLTLVALSLRLSDHLKQATR